MKFTWVLLVLAGSAAGAGIEEARRAGAVLEGERRWTEAASVYESALAELPSEAPPAQRFWLAMSLAEVSFEARDYDAARRWLGRAIPSDDRDRSRLLNARGTLHLVEGNLSAAARDLARAIDLTPGGDGLAAVLHNLAAVEMHTGRLRDAIAHERKALDLWRAELGDRHAYVVKAWVGLSSAQGLAGDWRGAAASLEEAMRVERTPEVLANYAAVLKKLGRGKEARAFGQTGGLAALPPLVDVRSSGAPIRTR